MLPKRERLTTERFDQVFKTGKRYHSPYFQIITTPSPTFHGAVVVGKKVYKKAVDRNRLRRQLYGVLYRHQQTQTKRGIYIIIAKPAIIGLSQAARTKTLTKTLTQHGL